MNEEIPVEITPLRGEEKSIAAKLKAEDLSFIETAILAECSKHWLKVARVVIRVEDNLKARYAGLTYIFYTEYLQHLVEKGRLDSKGHVFYIRHSEVRIPTSLTDKKLHPASWKNPSLTD